MANLRHPHIAQVWDFDEENGIPFYIMEYFCNNLGLMLGELEDSPALSRSIAPAKVFHYGKQILQGLMSLHRAGIIHRDIKPHNIMISDYDEVKIVDFGLCLSAFTPASSHESVKIGSFIYAAPEQKNAPDSVDERADLYSTGVLLHRMLFGVPPGEQLIIDADLREITDIWKPFFDKCLCHNPQNRFTNAHSMLEAFSKLEQEWQLQKETFCRIAGPTYEEPLTPDSPLRLRTAPLSVTICHSSKAFNLTELMRPQRYINNQIEENDDGTIIDHSTSLIWQQDASPQPVTWHQAITYVEKLNEAQQRKWRLPTVDELLSLLNQEGLPENFCLENPFAGEQKRFWSADQCPPRSAWYICMDVGYAGYQDIACHCFVRAVTSLLDP